MAFTHKENSGSIFKNEKREKDTHPHGTGSALIGGVEYWVSAWTKEGDKGRWQSLAFKAKEPATEKKANSQKKSDRRDVSDIDNDIPW